MTKQTTAHMKQFGRLTELNGIRVSDPRVVLYSNPVLLNQSAYCVAVHLNILQKSVRDCCVRHCERFRFHCILLF